MAATLTLREARTHPDFERFMKSPRRWKMIQIDGRIVDGQLLDGGDFIYASPFGSIEPAVVIDGKGRLVHDRPITREAPHVITVTYYLVDGEPYVAILSQPRPQADDPYFVGTGRHPAVVFGQPPMGFMKVLEGGKLEDPDVAAIREAGEEAGADGASSVEAPNYPHLFPNPTCIGTSGNIRFVKIDRDRIGRPLNNPNEQIEGVEYVTLSELLVRIRAGQTPDGAVYRMGTALAALMIFIAHHPEFVCFLLPKNSSMSALPQTSPGNLTQEPPRP